MRVIEKDGEPWFVAKDVAEVLGYAQTDKAIRDHCKASTRMTPPKQPGQKGGAQFITIIPERDVYRLVIRSKLPAAEKFEEWVVGEVLPAIRKTGTYSTDPLTALNVNRRQLTPSQKAAVALEVLPMLEAEAKERQREAGKDHSINLKNQEARVLSPVREPVKTPHSTRLAAEILGVSNGNISEIKRIARVAPEKVDEIRAGTSTIHNQPSSSPTPPSVRIRKAGTA